VFLHPQKILDQSYVGEGMSVADIGAGSGHLVFPLARAVGEFGKVHAIDVQQGLLAKIKNEATRLKLDNLSVRACDVEKHGATGLHDQSQDRVFMVNVLFQLEHKDAAITEAKRILKKKGRLIVIDWSDSYNNLGPHQDHVVTKAQALKLLTSHGFKIDREIDAGEHHYGLVLHHE
jgi:ubiquinone/menaquinone biosynthesis C-methylase UbiE